MARQRKPVESTLLEADAVVTDIPEKPVAGHLTRRRAVPEPPKPEPDSELAVLERIAKDPTVDVGKLREIIELQKDIRKVRAKIAFDEAFNRMQPHLPAIKKNGKIVVKGQLRSRFARLGEDIQPVIMPILHEFGFSLRHRTTYPPDKPGVQCITALLSHSGHTEESVFEAPMDKSEYRTDLQSMASTRSFGRRYTTVDVLNLTLIGVDDDGQGGGSTRQRENPETLNPDLDKPITLAQRDDLAKRAVRAGRTVPEMSTWLAARFGVPSSAELKRRVFQYVCESIEAPGPLPMPEDGE